jgi:hypothetical protein
MGYTIAGGIGFLLFISNSKFRTILRRFSDRSDCQKLLTSIGVRLSGSSFFEFGIADCS